LQPTLALQLPLELQLASGVQLASELHNCDINIVFTLVMLVISLLAYSGTPPHTPTAAAAPPLLTFVPRDLRAIGVRLHAHLQDPDRDQQNQEGGEKAEGAEI
jgi:hypothetical protein